MKFNLEVELEKSDSCDGCKLLSEDDVDGNLYSCFGDNSLMIPVIGTPGDGYFKTYRPRECPLNERKETKKAKNK